MAPSRWSLFAIIGGLLLLGLPSEVKLEAPTEETKTASVKECKVHIEKALEQYWDQKEPKKTENAFDQADTSQNHPVTYDDNENDDDSESAYETESQIQDDRTNDNEENDDESDSDQTISENREEENEDDEEEDANNPEDEDDDEDEDEDEDDTPNETKESTESTDDDNEEDDGNSENNVDDEDTIENNEEEEEVEEDDDEEAEEEEEDVEQESAESETLVSDKADEIPQSVDDKVEEPTSTEKVEEEEDDEKDVDDEENEDDEEEDAGEDEAVEQKVEESITEDEEEDEEEDDDEEGEEVSTAESTEVVTEEVDEQEDDEEEEKGADTEEEEESKPEDIESDKVTGDADSASAGVVSELPEEKPSLEQPPTPTPTPAAQEEAVKVTDTPQLQTDSDEDDDEEDIPSELKEDKDDDTIENIYEEDEDESSSTVTFRSRDHIDVILGLDEIGTEYDKEEDKLAQSIFREIKKIEQTNIKPMEMLYKYSDSTTRVLGDAEIFNKPMLLFLGPWSAGKTTIINYLLGIERTPLALKTGTGITDVDFTLVTYGDQKQMVSGTELAADWRYTGVQKFGQGFLDHFRSISIPSTLLKKVTLVDTPGILENKKNTERGYSLNDAFQWFIDRADAIYVVLDPNKVDIGAELGSVVDQLKGRDVRFILNKADTIRRSDLMRVVGQLFWNLSPLMSSTEAPIIYAVSLTTKPFHPAAPARFLTDQENNFFYDMKDTLDRRVENRILYARRHAVRVRNHAKMVDCYLATYYRHKSIFSNKKHVAKSITENPRDYHIFEGLSSMTNVSRYDLPDPNTYKDFFKLHPLYDFKPLASTCSYFRGCPMDKLDAAIAKEIPELFAKYKKAKSTSDTGKQEGR